MPTTTALSCRERGQPIAKGQKAFIVTLGNHAEDHTISESVFLRLPVSKQLKRKLKPDERGIHVYNTTIDEAGVPKKGDFLFSMAGSLAEISIPRIWEEHLNNWHAMLKSEAEGRGISEDEVAYVVSHPGCSRIDIVSEQGLEKKILRAHWRMGTPYELGQAPALNFHKPVIVAEGQFDKGEILFSIDLWALTEFPGLYSQYYKWPWEK